jgi:ferrous iron transport protein A
VQLSFNKKRVSKPATSVREEESLAHLRRGEEGVLSSMDLPEELSQRLMELGFYPGTSIAAAGCAPGGDPRVYRVDGAEVALRLETARRVGIRRRQSGD